MHVDRALLRALSSGSQMVARDQQQAARGGTGSTEFGDDATKDAEIERLRAELALLRQEQGEVLYSNVGGSPMKDPYISRAASKARARPSDIPELEEWVAHLDEWGFVVIPDFLDQAQTAQIRHAFDTEVEILPLGERGPAGADNRGDLVTRGHNLLAKTRACDFVYTDPRLMAIVESMLGEDITINITTQFNLLPGAKAQALHSDDGLWPVPRPHPHFLCNCVIAVDDFEASTGATWLVRECRKQASGCKAQS